MRYFILSQPKAGTYLCANLFLQLGIPFTHMHIGETKYEQYDPLNLTDSRNNPGKYSRKMILSESLKLIPENNFAVGHLAHKPSNVYLLRDFRKVLMLRDRQEIIESADTWLKITGRAGNSTQLLNYHDLDAIAKWQKESDVFAMDFHDLHDKNEDVIYELQLFLFGRIVVDSEEAITKALNAPSLTKV